MVINTKRLCALMALKQMDLIDLATTAGVSPSTICKMKNGKASPNTKTIGKVSAALEVKPDELIKEW